MAVTMLKLVVAAAGALAGAAVAKELDKPSEQRDWHGDVAGVPYDLRPPTAEKLRKSAWDPGNPKLFVPHAFGVGWSVNFARVAEILKPAVAPAPPAAAPKELPEGGTATA
jgi:uncharacterized protein DUF5808